MTEVRRTLGTLTRASWAVPVAMLSAFVVTQYGDALRIPFINEDYAFLDTTRGLTMLSLWREPGLYVGPWFRPWSQGLHYWFFQNPRHLGFGLVLRACVPHYRTTACG